MFGYKLGVIGDDFIYDHDYQGYLDKMWAKVSSKPESKQEMLSRICDNKVKIFA